MTGRFLALVLFAATAVLVVIGTVWPLPEATVYAGSGGLASDSSTPQAALRTFGDAINAQAWGKAYFSVANKAQFTEPQFMADMMGYYPNLRTYSGLDTFEMAPVHGTD